MQGIHASSLSLDVCISSTRDARVGAGMSCPGRTHGSKCLLRPAVLAVGPLCISEVFMCMSYDWGITVIVHLHRGPIMFKVKFVACSNWPRSTLERSHTFVIGDVAQRATSPMTNVWLRSRVDSVH